MTIAIYVIAALAILFNFFVLFKSAKTWKVFHVVVLFFVLAASITFTIYAAMALKTRLAWVKVHHDQTQATAEAEKTYDQLKNGMSVDPGPDEPSLEVLKGRLERLLIHRRAVWRNNLVAQANANSIKLTLPIAEGGTTSRNMIANMVVHVFSEVTPDDGPTHPDQYLGEFKTVAADATSITITPTIPLSSGQIAQVNKSVGNNRITWAIYEVIPGDGHDIFVIKEDELDEDDTTENESIFGRLMSKEQIEGYFPKARLGLADADYEKFIQQYLYDGRAINKIKQENDQFNPPAKEIWIKVRFVKPLVGEQGETVDAAVKPGTAADKRPPYNFQGLAQTQDLMQGSKTEFKIGDVAVFDQNYGQRLINDGICRLVENVYVRWLQDFEQESHTGYRRLLTIADEKKTLIRETTMLTASTSLTNEKIDFRRVENDKLKIDLDKFSFERDSITNYRKQVDEKHAALTAKLSLLYRSNHQLATELATMQKKLAAEIDQRTDGKTENTSSRTRLSAE